MIFTLLKKLPKGKNDRLKANIVAKILKTLYNMILSKELWLKPRKAKFVKTTNTMVFHVSSLIEIRFSILQANTFEVDYIQAKSFFYIIVFRFLFFR